MIGPSRMTSPSGLLALEISDLPAAPATIAELADEMDLLAATLTEVAEILRRTPVAELIADVLAAEIHPANG